MRETEVAAVGKAWLESLGYEVFQEVRALGQRIDLVGRLAHSVIAVEAKVSFGLSVIAQAERWVGEASESWVCVPASSRYRRLGVQLCAELGIGVLYAGPARGWVQEGPSSQVELWARKHEPKHLARWEKRLHPEQKTAAPAGSCGGGFVTDFSLTAKRLSAWVAAHPGSTLREAVLAIDHHYSGRGSAIGHLGRLLALRDARRPRALSSLRIEGRGARARLWTTEEVF